MRSVVQSMIFSKISKGRRGGVLPAPASPIVTVGLLEEGATKVMDILLMWLIQMKTYTQFRAQSIRTGLLGYSMMMVESKTRMGACALSNSHSIRCTGGVPFSKCLSVFSAGAQSRLLDVELQRVIVIRVLSSCKTAAIPLASRCVSRWQRKYQQAAKA